MSETTTNYGSKTSSTDYRKALRRRKVIERRALSALQGLIREVEYAAERGQPVSLDRVEYKEAKCVLNEFRNSIPQ